MPKRPRYGPNGRCFSPGGSRFRPSTLSSDLADMSLTSDDLSRPKNKSITLSSDLADMCLATSDDLSPKSKSITVSSDLADMSLTCLDPEADLPKVGSSHDEKEGDVS